MTVIILLFITGALLLAAEVFLPGAVAGVAGVLALIAGSVLAFGEFGVAGGGLALVGALVLVGLMLYVELSVLPRTAFGRKMVIESKVDATSQPPVARAQDVVGKTAEAITALAPSGHVLVEGRRYEASCQAGFVTKGAHVRVVDVDNFRLIVTPL